MSERDIYIALGSNIEPERHVPAALAALATAYGPLAVSPLYRSAPVGFEGPDFVNGVVRGRTAESLSHLQAHLKALERRAGRDHTQKLATRELDLDLLLFGEETIAADGIVLPRPDILEYAFVLRPLAEIAPNVRHPETGRSLAWHWRHFEGTRIPLTPITLGGDTGSEKQGESGEESMVGVTGFEPTTPTSRT
ncbi:MAG: 2-amino-4-hydroxy-6-hydroxymethyldihydropteridine diphosphokinase [Gammaproteobacteria bacterium]